MNAPADPRARRDRWTRRLAGALRAVLIYALLGGGSAVFILPFIWMVGTSAKVEREMFQGGFRFLPSAPRPPRASPFLDPREVPPPRDANWPRARPIIEARLRALALPLPEPAPVNAADVAGCLAPAVFERLNPRLPPGFWTRSDADLPAALAPYVTPELADEAIRVLYRRLSLGAVRVRSRDLEEVNLTSGRPAGQVWAIAGNAATRLTDRESGGNRFTDWAYDFGEAKRGVSRLTAMLDLPFAVDQLHRIFIGLVPDDSWHALEFELEMGGKKYAGRRPEFLANMQESLITLQEYGPDDRADNKLKLWLPYEERARGPQYDHGPRKVKLTLTLRRNSPGGALWAKCLRNYRQALNYIPFWRYTATSIFLVLLNIVGTLLSCSLVAFAFARLQWPGRQFSFGLMMATMMIPAQVTMIPYFLIVKSLGWYNTLYPLWANSFFAGAFNVFLLRQFMRGIPRDLEDAARIDGCNSLQVYGHIVLPLVKPTLACIAIFTFMGVWNDFMGPLIYLSDQRLYPLSLGLYAFNVQAGGSLGMMMAGSLLMTLPVIVIFAFAQKYFIQGVTLTGMKG